MWAECDSCLFASCRTCVAANIVANPLSLRCMGCSADWTLEQVARSTSTLFMNGNFRRIRQQYLVAREQSVAPLFASALSNKREISRLSAELESINTRGGLIEHRLSALPSVSSQLYDMYRHHKKRSVNPSIALGCCMSCNGLLVKGKTRTGEQTSVHCLSCKRTGRPEFTSVPVSCLLCRADLSVSWLIPVDGTPCSPFAIGYCCDEPVVARLQTRKHAATDEGEERWRWASDAETAEFAKCPDNPLIDYAFVAVGDMARGPLMGGSKHPERSATGWGIGVFKMHGHLTTDATAGFLRRRVVRALVAAGVEPETARAFLLAQPDAPRTDMEHWVGFEHPSNAWNPLTSRERPIPYSKREPLLDASTRRELSDTHGSAPGIAAFAPGTIAIAPGLALPSSGTFPSRASRHDLRYQCDLLNTGAARIRPCNCESCSQSVYCSIQGALVKAPLEFMDNKITREDYEKRMVEYSGIACASREALIAVSVYTRLFEKVVLPYTEDKATSAECVAVLEVAHREITAFINETRQYYEMT